MARTPEFRADHGGQFTRASKGSVLSHLEGSVWNGRGAKYMGTEQLSFG